MSESTGKTSPFVIAASVAVVIASVVAIGAMTGLLPGRGAETGAEATSTPAESGKTAGEAATSSQPARPARKTVEQKPVAKAAVKDVPKSSAQAPVCGDCGAITAIRTVEQAGEGSGLGAVAGGVVGGLLGNQVGKGTGKDIATIAGAVGGGYAGHQIEKKVKTAKRYEITVRMDDGGSRTMVQEAAPAFVVGDKVRIVDGALVRN
ncbi:MAG: glycine zipper 2TM domain-containing protein [Candidatus Nitricoxidivorans perseverans]|uniref:Glycine zipper 2TM domain-containing protein n=1 Tax=Candidatus Nitricoxidivorans perseverans TaxID=2975601 RepID=A0AA49IUA2_9PROT|nr:MAG: glycine zipper 2TM domain-containing protein [Candidatus Nitricoxidivorans perseverans]